METTTVITRTLELVLIAFGIIATVAFVYAMAVQVVTALVR